jgi:hypothetical protein
MEIVEESLEGFNFLLREENILAAKNKYFNSSAKMFLNPASIFQLMK